MITFGKQQGIVVLGLSAFALTAFSAPLAPETSYANALFRQLTGISLPFGDSRRSEMEKKVREGHLVEAAHVATEDDSFFNTTLVQLAAPLSNRAESSLVDMNDFIAMIVGTARDDRDLREALFANARYGLAGGYPFPPGPLPLNLRKTLQRFEPQSPERPGGAGVLTSDQWAREHLYKGTNRRGIEYAFREFLCTPIADLADGSVPDNFVRRDVDHHPGGDSRTYESTCRRCHAGMDALGGAYAYYSSDSLASYSHPLYDHRPQGKMNQNGDVYPAGRITVDDYWVNLWTGGHNASLGWRGPTQGRGISELGLMLANTSAFSRCMIKRVFTEVCRKAPDPQQVQALSGDFESGGYKLRRLFENVAVSPGCIAIAQ